MRGLTSSRATRLFALPFAFLFAAPAFAQYIDNDIPSGTLGHWTVRVDSGGDSVIGRVTAETNAGAIVTSDVVFEYRARIDLGADGGGTFSLGTTQLSKGTTGDDEITSTGVFIGASGDPVTWTAVSTIPDGTTTYETTYTFDAGAGTLGAMRFHQYFDEDVLGAGGDVLFTRGSAATNDLRLFTVDNTAVIGVNQTGAFNAAQGLENASFVGWAADRYAFNTGLRGDVFFGFPALSPTGVVDTVDLPPYVHPIVGPAWGPTDVVHDMGWDVDPLASHAVIVTSMGGVPIVPRNEPPVVTCAAPMTFWSPSHDLVDAAAAFEVTDPDGDPVDVTVTVYSDESEMPETGSGSGRHAPDFKDERGGRGLLLRSERNGNGDGRYYIFVVTASDGTDTVTTACLGAVVPHSATQASLDAVLAEGTAAAADLQDAIDADDPAPAYLREHGVSEELGPKQ